MGQNQPKESDSKASQSGRINADGNARWSPVELKDRVSAKFQGKDAVNTASGTGSKANPGKGQ